MRGFQFQQCSSKVLNISLAIGLILGPAICPLISQAETRLPSLDQLSKKKPATGAVSSSKPSAISSLPVKGQITLTREVNIVPATKKVSLNMRDANIRDILNLLAKQGNFNLVLDESIEGTLTIDINNISINKALEYIFTVSNFAYTRDGNTMIVASQEAAAEKKLAARTFKAIPVQYKSAEQLANQLNDTVFSMDRPNGQKTAVVAFDGTSNSLLVMGSDSDLKLVADFMREMDAPRNRRVYQIRHNTPEYVANSIVANLFTPAATGSFGSSSSSGSSSGSSSSSSSSNSSSNSNSSSSNSSSSNSSSGSSNSSSSSSSTGTTSPLPLVFNSGGVTLVADAVSSTLTVMGTEEQMTLIDGIIDQVDVRRPQVAIEVSLIELSATDTHSLLFNHGTWRVGKFQLTFPTTISNAATFSFNQTPITASMDPLHRVSSTIGNVQRRVKVLANPTLIAMDGQQSSLSVTDQIATITSTTVTGGAATTTTSITTTPVGITLNVTPRVYNDGSVELNLAPNVSSPGEDVVSADASTTLVSTRSLQINGVRIPDGQTLVIGGLLNTNQNKNKNKLPFVGEIPGLGGLFNQQESRQLKTELVIVVTPHILKDDGVSYFANPPQAQSNYSDPNQGQIKPVSLPKFMGDEAAFPAAPRNASVNADSAELDQSEQNDSQMYPDMPIRSEPYDSRKRSQSIDTNASLSNNLKPAIGPIASPDFETNETLAIQHRVKQLRRAASLDLPEPSKPQTGEEQYSQNQRLNLLLEELETKKR